MEQYIDKSKVVAEIDDMLNTKEHTSHCDEDSFNSGRWKALTKVKGFLDTLEVKESLSLTWQDIRLIAELGDGFMNSEKSDNLSEEEYYTEILNRFKAQKGEEA